MLAALQRGWGTAVASLAAGRLQLSKTAEPVLSGLYHGNAMKMFDVVASLQDLPQQQVVKGQVGTVVEELDNDHVLVEFADVNGVAYAIATIPMGQLMKLKHAPLDRLRKRESSARAPYRVAFRPASWPSRLPL